MSDKMKSLVIALTLIAALFVSTAGFASVTGQDLASKSTVLMNDPDDKDGDDKDDDKDDDDKGKH